MLKSKLRVKYRAVWKHDVPHFQAPNIRHRVFEYRVAGDLLDGVHQVTDQVFNIKLTDLDRMGSVAVLVCVQLGFDFFKGITMLE